MAKLEYKTPLTLLDVAGTKLGDDVKPELGKVTLAKSHKGKSGDFSYQLGADLSVSIELFNSDQDKDKAHKVIGKVKPAGDPAASIGWQPLIERKQNDAWLKYTTSAAVQMGAQFDFGPVLGIKANGRVDHFYYHKQPRNKLIVNAITSGLSAQKLAFVLADVLSLGPDEAVGLATSGHVEASLKISWSDVFTTGMSRLAKLVDVPEAVAIKVSAGASASFKISLDDDFKLVFLGLGGDRFRIALRKAKTSSINAGVKVGIEAKLANPKQINNILQDVVAGLLGMTPDEITKMVTSFGNDLALKDLTGWKKDAADELIDRLGLDDDIERTGELLKRLLEFEKKTFGVIEEIAKTKASAGFSYEYSRVATDASIFEGDLTSTAVKRLFKDILGGRFRVLLDDAGVHPQQITVKRFLNEKSLVVTSALGFSLGFGKWAFSGKDNTVFKFVSQENAAGGLRYSLLGSRKYVGKDWSEGYSTYAEFKADMPEFGQPQQVPTLNQFDLGLSLIYEEDQKHISASELRSTIDLALVWGAGPEGDLDRVAEVITAQAGKRRKTESKVSLLVSNAAMRGFCEWIATRSHIELGSIIAGAMDYWDLYPTRHYIHSRRNAYAGIWAQALNERWKKPALASAVATKALRTVDSTLAHREKRAARQRDKQPFTIYGLFRNNPGLMDDLQDMRSAFARIRLAILNNEQYSVLEKQVPLIHKFSDNRFKIRVMGALVNAFRKSDAFSAGDINAAFSIKHARGEKILTIGQKQSGA